MKRMNVFLILSLVYILEAYSQTGSMVQEGRRWSIMMTATGLEPSLLPHVDTEISILLGDTTVNDIVYKKIYSSYNEDLSEMQLGGCIRQEGQKVFYLPINSSQEKLYFDFSLEKGDTFILDEIIRTVTSTGTMLINGKNHKTIMLESGNVEECWVEGIGSLITGIYCDHFIQAGGKYLLLCSHQDNDLLYMNEEYKDCYVKVSTSVEQLDAGSSAPSVYYIDGFLKIYGMQGEIFKFELYDVSGRKLLISKSMLSDEESINAKDITPGTYIYRLFNETSEYSNKLHIGI